MTGLTNGTTDSGGNVSLEYQESTSGDKQYYVELSNGDISSNVSVSIIDVDYLELEADDTIVANGQSTRITARAIKNNNPISNIAINMAAGTFITNSDGEAYIDYEGTGAGLITLNGACGETTSYVMIEDVIQYYSQENEKFFNVDYSLKNSLTAVMKYNGLQLISYVAYQQTSDGHIYFTYPNSKSENWTFEFDVISVGKGTSIQASGTFINYNQLNAKPRIYVVVKDGVKKVYLNDVEISSNTNSSLFVPYLVITGNIIIDNIKIIKEGVEQ